MAPVARPQGTPVRVAVNPHEELRDLQQIKDIRSTERAVTQIDNNRLSVGKVLQVAAALMIVIGAGIFFAIASHGVLIPLLAGLAIVLVGGAGTYHFGKALNAAKENEPKLQEIIEEFGDRQVYRKIQELELANLGQNQGVNFQLGRRRN